MKKVQNISALIAIAATLFFTACQKEAAVVMTTSETADTQEVDAIIRRLSDSIQFGGVQFLPKEEYDKLPKVEAAQLTPLTDNAVQLRSTSMQLALPPVAQQGREGSCTAFAVGYAGISYFLNKVNRLPYTQAGALRSPEFLYNTTKGWGDCNAGASLSNVLLNTMYKGVCSWSEMPYTDNGCTQQPTTTQKQQALQGRLKNYGVAYYSQVKQYLQAGYPIIMALQVDENFLLQTSRAPYEWKNKGGRVQGGHAVIIMGYDDSTRRYKVQNSWGTSVQDRGFFYLNYNSLPSFAQELYVMQPM